MRTIHITEQYQPHQVRNVKTFAKEHSAYLKRRKRLFLNGKQEEVEVISIMNQQLKEIEGTYHFTCDIQLKLKSDEEE